MSRLLSRIGAPLAVLAALAITLSACSSSGGNTDSPSTNPAQKSATTGGATTSADGASIAKIKQRGKLIVGVKFDQPLFGLKNPVNGHLEGFDVEIAKMIAKDLTGSADNIEYVETVTANREAFIQQKKVDLVIATYAVSDARKKVVGFAGPYYDTGVAIMVRKDDNSITDGKSLNGKKVCTVNGARAAELLPDAAPSAKVSLFSTYSDCAQALKEKRVDAVVTGETILLGIVEQNQDQFKMVPGYIAQEEDAIGFTKGDTAMHAYLDSFLHKIEDNGSWAKAYQDTIGTVTHKTPPLPKITL